MKAPIAKELGLGIGKNKEERVANAPIRSQKMDFC